MVVKPVAPWIRRALALAVLVGAGALVGVVGSRLTGSDGWYLAIPVALAAGWLWRADPTQCQPGPLVPAPPQGHKDRQRGDDPVA